MNPSPNTTPIQSGGSDDDGDGDRHPVVRCKISASASRFTPLISTVAIANVAALTACAAFPNRNRKYSVPAMLFLEPVMMPFYYGAKVRSVPRSVGRPTK
jgi:hypothetical protein